MHTAQFTLAHSPFILVLNFNSFVLLIYQFGIEIAKKKSCAQVTYKDPLGYIELPLSGLFQGFLANLELTFCVTKSKLI